MAMQKCKDCGSAISSDAKACPNCGKDPRNFFQKHPVITVVLIIFVIGIVGASFSSNTNNSNLIAVSGDTNNSISTDTNKPIEYYTVSIDELNDELEKNAATAKQKYNGQYVEITGILKTIDSDLKYIGVYSTTDAWDLRGIHCSIKNQEQRNIITNTNISIKDTITVKGKITDVGEILGYFLDITEIIK